MIPVTQILRPGQNNLHREAARRLWKLCQTTVPSPTTSRFAGHLFTYPGELTCAPSQHTFPRVGGCSVACVVGDVNAGRWREDCHGLSQKSRRAGGPGAKSCKQTRLRRESNVEVFLSPWVLRRKMPGWYSPEGRHSGYAPRGI